MRAPVAAVRRDLEEIATAAAAEVEKNKIIAADLETIGKEMNVVLNASQNSLLWRAFW